MPVSSQSSSSSATISAWTSTSSAEVGLVGDEQPRPGGDGERDGDALGLAAGELVRIGGERPLRVGDADARQERGGPGAGLDAGEGRCARSTSTSCAPTDEERVEASAGVLEDIADVAARAAADRPAQRISPREPVPGRQQPGDGAGERGLARARLADHRELLAGDDVEVDVGERRARARRR